MSNSMPSMLALLGLAAVAGFQNRDKLRAMMKDAGARGRTAEQTHGLPTGARTGADLPENGSLLSDLGAVFGGKDAGAALSDALTGIVRTLGGDGQRGAPDSWVASGPNRPMAEAAMRDRLGPALLADLVRRTGLPEQTLVERLSANLPGMIDAFTPEGRIPSAEEAARLL